jgi:hypothetical protein
VTVKLAERESVPLVPVTVTVNDPTALPATDNVDVPVPPEVRVTVLGASDATMAVEETDVESETVPENLLRLFNWMEAVPDEPRPTLIVAGIVEIVKSGCVDEFTVTVADDCPDVDLESVTLKVAK